MRKSIIIGALAVALAAPSSSAAVSGLRLSAGQFAPVFCDSGYGAPHEGLIVSRLGHELQSNPPQLAPQGDYFWTFGRRGRVIIDQAAVRIVPTARLVINHRHHSVFYRDDCGASP